MHVKIHGEKVRNKFKTKLLFSSIERVRKCYKNIILYMQMTNDEVFSKVKDHNVCLPKTVYITR